jgi:hypothetical protein
MASFRVRFKSSVYFSQEEDFLQRILHRVPLTAVLLASKKHFHQISLNFSFFFWQIWQNFEVDILGLLKRAGPFCPLLPKTFGLFNNTVQQATWCSWYLSLRGTKQLFLFLKSLTAGASSVEMELRRAAPPEFWNRGAHCSAENPSLRELIAGLSNLVRLSL